MRRLCPVPRHRQTADLGVALSLSQVEDPDRYPRLIATGRAAIAAMTCGQINVLTSTPCGSHRMHVASSTIHKGASPAPQTPVVPSLSVVS